MQQNFSLRKGNDFGPIGFDIGTVDECGEVGEFDLTGSEIIFLAQWSGGQLRKTSEDSDGLVITGKSTFTLSLTRDEGRLMPAGDVKYEIERRVPDVQDALVFGLFKVTVGINDD